MLLVAASDPAAQLITHEAVSLPPAKTRALLRFYLPELEAFAACLRRHGRLTRPSGRF